MQMAVQRAEKDVADEQAIISDLQRCLSTMKDAETGQRGYLLTEDESYLTPNLDAKAHIQEDLADLDRWVGAGLLDAPAVKRYRDLATAKLLELDATIDAKRAKGVDAAVAIVRTDRGKQIMDKLRDLNDQLLAQSAERLTEDARTEQRFSSTSMRLLWSVVAVNLGFLAWAYSRIRREIGLREAAALETYRQRELLQVTLASIGDGVIVTDAGGKITFLNKVAQQLCGWTREEAIGMECTKVFNIINEETRSLVESPVEKVLRTGVVVGLANHTLLVRKDGTETPIDDSGAPIHDNDGSVRGVVLVFRDFSEHKKAEDALRQAMTDAQAANVAKDNFLATLSHELRTPLTPVVLTLASWIETQHPPEDWREDAQMMQRNLELEARLIDDLLDLTRIVRGKLSLNETVADVNQLVEAVARMYQSEIYSNGLRLHLDLRAIKKHAFVDPARLQQVVLNVLKNATKFTAEGGSIDIETQTRDDRIEISVRDTGMGMTEELQSRLFRPFEQGTGEIIKRYGGLGLGMAISKALMEAQGGSISASSGGPGYGSIFTLSIPAVEQEQALAQQNLANNRPYKARSFRILLVEDHFDTARALARLLERSGHEVTLANSLFEAEGYVKRGGYDLMLSDIGLQDGTGLELIRKVRAISDLPAVALTGFGMEEDVVNCRVAGFNEHLTKPINFQRLEFVIDELMRDRTTQVTMSSATTASPSSK